jgi:hypothetical protein
MPVRRFSPPQGKARPSEPVQGFLGELTAVSQATRLQAGAMRRRRSQVAKKSFNHPL